MSKTKIFIAGHNGMVGSALVNALKEKEFDIITKQKSELDLLNQKDVLNFFNQENIDQVYLAAAKVGGIYANNTYPAEFIYENLMIQANIIHSSFLTGIKKLLFLGSSCIYPKNSTQPIKEDELLKGKLEPTNEPYAIAKISGIKMCESYNRQYGKSHGIDYRSVMPTNLYGPGDTYHPENSHVIPGLIYKFHNAKINNLSEVIVWGTGMPKREFLFVNDLADAACYIMNLDKKIFDKKTKLTSLINIGSGIELTIRELADIIKEIVDYKGQINFDTNKPDGSNRKLLDSNILHSLGWKPKTDFKDGLIRTYKKFIESR